MTDLLQRGAVVSFDVYPTATLGNNFKNVRIDGILDADLTRYVNGYDAPAMHNIVFPTLPQGSCPDNFAAYSYLKVTHANGEVSVVGVPYINMSTLVSKSVDSAVIKVSGIKLSDVPTMREALAGAGFKVDSIDLV